MKKNTVISNYLLSAILFLMMPVAAFAKDCSSDIKAVTSEDPTVPVEVLEHQVKPLTKCELEAEAAAWVLLLQEKVSEISNAEVAAIYKKQEIESTEDVEEALEDVEEAREEADSEETREASEEAKEALKDVAEAEKKLLTKVLSNKEIKIEHIGSTAIEGLVAKPIIDIMIGLKELILLLSKYQKLNL